MTGSLESLRDKHKGSTAIVRGNGPSRTEIAAHASNVELVVNDGVSCGRASTVYRVVADRPHLLRRDGRFKDVVRGEGVPLLAAHNRSFWEDAIREEGESLDWMRRATFYDPATRHPRQPPWDPLATGRPWQYDGGAFAACSIAAIMGCARIGVIGIDMRGEGFSGKLRDDVDFNYTRLRKVLAGHGIELVSLSARNSTVSLPSVRWHGANGERTKDD